MRTIKFDVKTAHELTREEINKALIVHRRINVTGRWWDRFTWAPELSLEARGYKGASFSNTWLTGSLESVHLTMTDIDYLIVGKRLLPEIDHDLLEYIVSEGLIRYCEVSMRILTFWQEEDILNEHAPNLAKRLDRAITEEMYTERVTMLGKLIAQYDRLTSDEEVLSTLCEMNAEFDTRTMALYTE